MKKILTSLSLLMLVTACGTAPMPKPTEEIAEVLIEQPKVEEVVEETTVYQPGLQEFYDNPPEGYCDKRSLKYVEVWDEENYFTRFGNWPPGQGGPSYSYCMLTIFLNTAEGHNIYAVSDITSTPMISFPNSGFFQYIDSQWVDITESIVSMELIEMLAKRGTESIAQHRPELTPEGLESNWIMELPQHGTTIKFIHYNTDEVLHQLKWTGTQFIVVD